MTNTVLGFATQQKFPVTAIDTTIPVRVTIPNHGLSNGQFVRATNFFLSPVALATGMYDLNNTLYMVSQVTTDTFDLYDVYGNPIDGTGFTPYIANGLSLFTLTGPDLDTQNLNTMGG